MDEQLVRVHLPFRGNEDFDRWVALEERLDEAAQAAGVGSLDGNEIGEGEYTIWMYGPDASKLAPVLKRVLMTEGLPNECYLFVRHGSVSDEQAREETIPL